MYVFNQKYIEDNFLNTDKQNPIFILGKENVEIKKRIDEIDDQLAGITQKQEKEKENKIQATENKNEAKENLKDKVWSQMTTLFKNKSEAKNLLLTGYQNNKSKYFDELRKIKSSGSSNEIPSSEEIIRKAQDYDASSSVQLPSIDTQFGEKNQLSMIEKYPLFLKSSVSASDSLIGQLAKENENLDWVKHGLKYLEKDSDTHPCPFCSQHISKALLGDINSLFDNNYRDLENLKKEYTKCKERLNQRIEELLEKEKSYNKLNSSRDLFVNIKKEFKSLEKSLQRNIEAMDDKLKDISIVCEFQASDFEPLEKEIKRLKDAVGKYNSDITNPNIIKNKFNLDYWQSIRSHFNADIIDWQKEDRSFEKEITGHDEVITKQKKDISELTDDRKRLTGQQTNTSQAVSSINSTLKFWGSIGLHG